jgi:hypothetical protein
MKQPIRNQIQMQSRDDRKLIGGRGVGLRMGADMSYHIVSVFLDVLSVVYECPFKTLAVWRVFIFKSQALALFGLLKLMKCL